MKNQTLIRKGKLKIKKKKDVNKSKKGKQIVEYGSISVQQGKTVY
jgi:hypothetical protein